MLRIHPAICTFNSFCSFFFAMRLNYHKDLNHPIEIHHAHFIFFFMCCISEGKNLKVFLINNYINRLIYWLQRTNRILGHILWQIRIRSWGKWRWWIWWWWIWRWTSARRLARRCWLSLISYDQSYRILEKVIHLQYMVLRKQLNLFHSILVIRFIC